MEPLKDIDFFFIFYLNLKIKNQHIQTKSTQTIYNVELEMTCRMLSK